MTPNTLLHRQIHPVFVQAGRVSSQAFRPTPKDESRLSCYDGDVLSARESWKHYTEELHLQAIGTMSVSVQECTDTGLSIDEDRTPFPAHVSLDFTGFSKSQVEKIASKIRDLACTRSWTFGPTIEKNASLR